MAFYRFSLHGETLDVVRKPRTSQKANDVPTSYYFDIADSEKELRKLSLSPNIEHVLKK
jgi:hypothetical protein